MKLTDNNGTMRLYKWLAMLLRGNCVILALHCVTRILCGIMGAGEDLKELCLFSSPYYSRWRLIDVIKNWKPQYYLVILINCDIFGNSLLATINGSTQLIRNLQAFDTEIGMNWGFHMWWDGRHGWPKMGNFLNEKTVWLMNFKSGNFF